VDYLLKIREEIDPLPVNFAYMKILDYE